MIGLWDVDAFSGFRITSGPRRPGPHEEYSEAPHFHSITSGQGGDDLVEKRVVNLFDILCEQTRILLRDARNQFRFDHLRDFGQHLNGDAVKGHVDVILALMAAMATALLLGLIARDDIGMPPYVIREDTLITACIMVAAVAESGGTWIRI